MLKHTVIGPNLAGDYLVVYPTPGCNVPTTVCDCSSADQALAEAKRLNRVQRNRALAESTAKLATWRKAARHA